MPILINVDLWKKSRIVYSFSYPYYYGNMIHKIYLNFVQHTKLYH